MSNLAQRLSALSPRQRELLERRLEASGAALAEAPILQREGASDTAPLSFAQERLWFLDQLEPGNAAYNIGTSQMLEGDFDVAAFVASLHAVVERHEALATSFSAVDGKPLQRIHRDRRAAVGMVDLTRLDEETRLATARRWVDVLHRKGFDLKREPLLRVGLLRLSPARHALIISVHHIVADGWSLNILIREILSFYAAFAAGRRPQLPPLPIRYADFAAWQRRWISGKILETEIDYWRRRLAGAPPLLTLPTDRPRPPVQTFRGEMYVLLVQPELTAALAATARTAGATLFMTLMAGFQAVLMRYSGQRDVCVGMPILGRSRVETEGLIGLFANTLVLRADASRDRPSLLELVERTRQAVLEAEAHQNLPFEKLVEVLKPERNLAYSPVFQVMFAMQTAMGASTGGGLPGLAVTPFVRRSGTTIFDFNLEMTHRSSGRVAGHLFYSTDLFDATTVERFAGHFLRLLEAVAARPDLRIEDVPLYSAGQRHQVLVEWNDSAAAPRFPRPAYEIFAERAAAAPTAVAVTCGGRRLTYGELDERSDRLAGELAARGVGRGETLVGVALRRSPDLLVTLLGIFKAGGAYVPLDPSYPRQRLAFMLADSRAPVLVTESPLAGELPHGNAEVVLVDRLEGPAAPPPRPEVELDSLAYVIYTSGSTGRPKGVEVSHRSLVNLLGSMNERPGIGPDDVPLAVTSLSFDVSVPELFLPLLIGGRLELVDDETVVDGRALLSLLGRSDATVMQATPATFRLLLAAGWESGGDGPEILCGGEAMSEDLAAALRQRSPSVWNMYGPTEATVYAAVGPVPGGPVAIGRPVANGSLQILDPYLGPVPQGAVGELYIGGTGVARGYRGRPALSAAAFVPTDGGGRLYRTGDLARFLPDGAVQCLGRRDHQVKVRGFRIELGEIEARLGEAPGVRQAVAVLHRTAGGDPRLVAYVVPDKPAADDAAADVGLDAVIDSLALRRFLEDRLPVYMVPSAFVAVESLPRTPSGKVDRARLAARRLAAPVSGEVLKPRNAAERTIVEIWKEVLEIDEVGVGQSFFDIGGHSLLLVQVQSRLRRAFGREVTVVDLFRYPTVAALAGFLRVDEPRERHMDLGRGRAERRRAAAAARGSDVAIVGMSIRSPGAFDLDRFWTRLRDGVESVREYSDEELREAGVPQEVLERPDYVKAGIVLEGLDELDARLFGISPREAELMDPQQRIFLECAWEALEHAGHDPESQEAAVGVFAGLGMNRYWRHVFSDAELLREVNPFQIMVANDKDFLATRVSYKLNLRGPSAAVQTACSTSLVATHLACQSLLAGECDLALAGGVALTSLRKGGYFYDEDGILSPDGHCRAFDARGAGTVGGSGAGIVVLKRLADAVADGDTIHAVIRGSAINNDGAAKVGFTAPSVTGQAQVIAEALALAGVEPASVSYVEAHGTATHLGDPIEFAALREVFGSEPGRRCALGSVKTNLGHTDTAAGVTGLIKTVLALGHRQIPPSLHFATPNPQIDFEASPFYVATELEEWQAEGPRRAGVSSFGLGGTNAHVVVEEAPEPVPSGPSRPWQLLVLSAATDTALAASAERLARHLEEAPDTDLADVAFTLRTGRRRLRHRRALVCRDRADALAMLGGRHPERVLASAEERLDRRVAFLFPGVGDHYTGMAGELYRTEPTFRAAVDRCAEVLEPLVGADLRSILYPAGMPEAAADAPAAGPDLRRLLGRTAEPRDEALDDTRILHPAVFTIDYALARLWMEWGLEPEALVGYSLGEYVAACVAGVLSLEDALALVAERARLISELPEGAMLAVPLAERKLVPRLGRDLWLAATNAPQVSVAAGSMEAVAALERELAAAGIVSQRLGTRHAFHSGMMQPIAEAFGERVSRVELRAPRIPYASNVTGTWIAAGEATDPRYWVRHLCQTVRFSEAMGEILGDAERLLVEVGPGQALAASARQHGAWQAEHLVVSSLRDARTPRSDVELLLESAGRLWLAGLRLDWRGFARHETRRRVPLPGYPFERRRYWIDPKPATVERRPAPQVKNENVAEWFYLPFWKPSPLPLPFDPTAQEPASWLLFADDTGLGAALARRLAEAGHEVVTVRPGDGFARLDDHSFALRPAERADYGALIAALGAPPRKIVHLWGVTAEAGTPANGEGSPGAAAQGALDLGFYSVLRLLQTLGDRGSRETVELNVVANGLHRVRRQDPLWPEKSAVLGPLKVARQEQAYVVCRSLDLGAERGADEALLAELAAEIASPPDPDFRHQVVAYRDRERWVCSYEPVTLADVAPSRLPLRREGVYLVTGGLGGIGRVFARYLAEEHGARLVLTGRSALPERAEWGAWIDEHGAGETTSRRIAALRELEEAGAETLALTGDVADETAMRRVVETARRRFGSIHGVIHAAGLAGEGMMQLKTREAAERILASKVEGTRVLERVLADEPLDFVVLCSSVASMLGGLGQADYCAANNVFDALAHEMAAKRPGVTTVAVNWGPWEEVGMAVEPEAAGRGGVNPVLIGGGIRPREGVEALRLILSRHRGAQIVATPKDLLGQLEGIARARAETEEGPAAGPSLHPRPGLATPYAAPEGEMEEALAELWQGSLGIEKVGRHDNFFQLGGDSLLAMQLISRLRQNLHVELPLRAFYAAPTVAELAQAAAEGHFQHEELSEIEKALQEIQELSPDEIAAELQAELREDT